MQICFVTISCAIYDECSKAGCLTEGKNLYGGEFMFGSNPIIQQIRIEYICREDSSQILLCRSKWQDALLLTEELTGPVLI